MGCSFSLEGSVLLRDTPEARDHVSRLDSDLGDIQYAIATPGDADFAAVEPYLDSPCAGVLLLRIWGGLECSYGTASAIEDAISALGPFAVGAGRFTSVCDGEPNVIWVGDDAAVDKAERRELVQAAREAVAELTDDEKLTIGVDPAVFRRATA